MSAHRMQYISDAWSNTLDTPPILRPRKRCFETLNSANSQVITMSSLLQIMLSGRLLRVAPALQSEFIRLLPSARCRPWRRPGRGTCRRASASAAAPYPAGSTQRRPAGPRPPPAQGCALPWCCSTPTMQLRACECSDSNVQDCEGAAAPRSDAGAGCDDPGPYCALSCLLATGSRECSFAFGSNCNFYMMRDESIDGAVATEDAHDKTAHK